MATSTRTSAEPMSVVQRSRRRSSKSATATAAKQETKTSVFIAHPPFVFCEARGVPDHERLTFSSTGSCYDGGMDPRTRAFAREHLQNRAAEDPAFRASLLADPRAAIKDLFGQELPPEYEVQVVEETPTRLVLVLPLPGPTRDSSVTLREITKQNLNAILNLEVKESQRGFVAPNPVSVAQMHYEPTAWARAIYADETPVGFVMLKDDPDEPRYYVWRYMVAGEYQGFGFGRRAMEQVIEYVRTRPRATELFLSYVPGEGSPRDFYTRLGFQDTGVRHGPENEMKLVL